MTSRRQQINGELESLRLEWRMWDLQRGYCGGLHIDEALLPGTDEGDHSTAYRADHKRQIEAQAAVLKAELAEIKRGSAMRQPRREQP